MRKIAFFILLTLSLNLFSQQSKYFNKIVDKEFNKIRNFDSLSNVYGGKVLVIFVGIYHDSLVKEIQILQPGYGQKWITIEKRKLKDSEKNK